MSGRRCPLAGPGARMTMESFVKCCVRERSQRSINPAITIKYVCDDCATWPQVDAFLKKRMERERLLLDGDIDVADLRRDEIVITAPDGIEFISLHKLKKERAMSEHDKGNIPGNWLDIPPDLAERITLKEMIPFWKIKPMKAGRRGVCPNCRRPDLTMARAGICGGCYYPLKNLVGIPMLQALAKQGKKLQGQYQLLQSCGAEKGVAQNEEIMEIKETGEAVEKIAVLAAVVEKLPPQGIGLTEVQQLICAETEQIKDVLIEKNRAYGNSAIDPVRIFSKCDPEEQINVRLDDKLSRLMRGQNAGEDVELDLIGYLVLRRVYRRMSAGAGK